MGKLALSVCWAVGVTLGCILLGMLLSSVGVGVASIVGGFLSKWSVGIGIISGIWYYFSH